MEFKRLAEVETVEAVNDGDTVLIEQGGEVKRAPKSQVGGAGGYIMKPTVEECIRTEGNNQIVITKDFSDIAKAVEAGAHVSIVIPDGVYTGEMPGFVLCPSVYFYESNMLVAVAPGPDGSLVISFPNGSYTPSFG